MDEHLDFSDLPSLPPDQIRVMGHIIRNKDIRRSELEAALSALPEGDAIAPDALADILDALVAKKLLRTGEADGETTYRVRMRRKTSQIMTIQGIWKALDGVEESLELNINPEMRKTRSPLADGMLADLSNEQQYDFNRPPADPEAAAQVGQSLLDDLASAGRTTMSKRAGKGQKGGKAEKSIAKGRALSQDIAASKPPQDEAAARDTLDELATSLKRQTGINPVARPDDKPRGLWAKLSSWLGFRR